MEGLSAGCMKARIAQALRSTGAAFVGLFIQVENAATG
jgi:hypothetical protein